MSAGHPEIGPELRRLAQAILDGIDPAVRAAAALTAGRGPGTGKCQQVWCPVCALAAVATGDQHPLVTVIADHSVALLEVLRAMLDDINGAPKPPPGGPAGGPPADGVTETPAPDAATRTRYQPIPVTVEE